MAYYYVPSKLSDHVEVEVSIRGYKSTANAELPEHCVGVLYAFDSHEAAKDYGGDVEVIGYRDAGPRLVVVSEESD